MDGVYNIAFIGTGGPEILVILLVLLMMFGAKDAPRILRKLNGIFNQFRNTADEFKREIMYSDLNSPSSTDTPSMGDEGYDYDAENEYDYDVEDDYDYDNEEYDFGDEKEAEESSSEEEAEVVVELDEEAPAVTPEEPSGKDKDV